ncbi:MULTISPECIES: hypothetical protein [unclassified Rathayibacter]|uniref:hypothetical protein n=1 Tax=unclassified Rathayibacter TaxID=2609250 RepID=UPI001FB3BE31|nr:MULTISPECIES: hypothetical protein [unclassified Rathayibacter]MCJ1672023.1 hypothetical protein [Rathayibacter sp. VKM Ac-2929]MCJ1683808.1 hypothetical protein [Rathayibacter sp. VKM Ac-2928]
MSLRGTSLRSRSRLACLTLVVGLAGGLIAPAAAASTSTPEPTATAVATSTPTATPTPTAVPTATPQPTGTAMPSATPTVTPTVVPTTTPSATPEPTTTPTATPEPTPAEPQPAAPGCDPFVPPALPFDAAALTVDLTQPGTVTATVPPSELADCTDGSTIILAIMPTLTETTEDIASAEVVVGDEGYAGGTLTVPVRTSREYTVTVTVIQSVDGSPTWILEPYTQVATLYATDLEACLGANRNYVVESLSGPVTATAGVRSVTVTVPEIGTIACVPRGEIRIFSFDYERPNELDDFTPVLLGTIPFDGGYFPGATRTFATTPGHNDVRVTIVGFVDGGETGREYVGDQIHLTVASGAVTTTSGGSALAETGVETAGLASGAAALLALGLVSLVVTRRRRSAQQS